MQRKDCWNRFLREPTGKGAWRAAHYTSQLLDHAYPTRVTKRGRVAEGSDHSGGPEGVLRVGPGTVRTDCQVDALGKLVERAAAFPAADHPERRNELGLHGGQYGCRRRRSCVDAVAVPHEKLPEGVCGGGETFSRGLAHGCQSNVQESRQGAGGQTHGGAGIGAGPDTVNHEQHVRQASQTSPGWRGRTGDRSGYRNPASATGGPDPFRHVLCRISSRR